MQPIKSRNTHRNIVVEGLLRLLMSLLTHNSRVQDETPDFTIHDTHKNLKEQEEFYTTLHSPPLHLLPSLISPFR
jgi:hypothetical protein